MASNAHHGYDTMQNADVADVTVVIEDLRSSEAISYGAWIQYEHDFVQLIRPTYFTLELYSELSVSQRSN